MWVWVDRIGATILDTSLAAAVLLGLAALAMVACRQPARRCGLARAAIVASLALFPLVAYGPSRPRIEVVGPLRAVLEPVLPGGGERLESEATSAFRPSPAATDQVTPFVRWAPRVLTVVYVLGASASLAWLLLGWWCSAWLIQRAAHPDPTTRDVYLALPYAHWWRPRLRVGARLSRPVLLGSARPVILIPPDLDRPEARERLRLSLLHELAHAERRDSWFSLAGNLALAAWFFVPWLWWVRRQMRLDQEFLADHNAASGFGPFGAYASSLVELADPGPGPAAPTAAPAREIPLFGTGSALFQRVLMLVRCPYPVETRAPRWWRLGLPPVVACGTLLASSLTLRSAEPQTTPQDPPAVASSVASAPSFQVSRLVIAESPAGPDGWTPPHNLPFALPEQFELSLEIWAEARDLAQTRLAGCRLGPRAADATATGDAPRWHKVRVKREPKGVVVEVDGTKIPLDEAEGPRSSWLSIQPAPDRLGLIRNLLLTW
jgi:beta-lactamase regulating signal transducer with metallopeptidase domain